MKVLNLSFNELSGSIPRVGEPDSLDQLYYTVMSLKVAFQELGNLTG